MKKCYYKSLHVDQDASIEEIKASFYELSKKTHPDTGGNAERFKEISHAYKVLSNKKERRRYDLELSERFWYQSRRRADGGVDYGHARYANMANRRPEGPQATGLYKVLDTMFRPRIFLLGMAGLCTVFMYQSVFGDDSKRKLMQPHHQGKQLVEAWFNPKTGKYEQAAPWDKNYQRLKPKLELVPREQVQTRTR